MRKRPKVAESPWVDEVVPDHGGYKVVVAPDTPVDEVVSISTDLAAQYGHHAVEFHLGMRSFVVA